MPACMQRIQGRPMQTPPITSFSVSSYEPCLVDFVGLLLLMSLTRPAPTILLPPLLWDFPKLHLVFRCGSLNLFPFWWQLNYAVIMRITLLLWLTFIIYYDYHWLMFISVVFGSIVGFWAIHNILHQNFLLFFDTVSIWNLPGFII